MEPRLCLDLSVQFTHLLYMLKIDLNLVIKNLGIIAHLLKYQNPARNYIIYEPLNMQFHF